MTTSPFNLSKQARRDPPTAFDLTSPDKKDPYRINKGKPGREDSVDKLRQFNQPSAINGLPGGGAGQFDNKEWPSDGSILTNNEGVPNRDNGTGTQTDFGIDLHDGMNPESEDAVLGKNQTSGRMLSDNRDRKPFNINNGLSPLKETRKRLRRL